MKKKNKTKKLAKKPRPSHGAHPADHRKEKAARGKGKSAASRSGASYKEEARGGAYGERSARGASYEGKLRAANGTHGAYGTNGTNGGAPKGGRGHTASPYDRHGRVREEEAIGLFRGTSRGFGFLVPEGEGARAHEDVFIPGHETGGALDGDTVRVRYTHYTEWEHGEERLRTRGRVTEILRARETAVGTLAASVSGYGRRRRVLWLFFPDNSRLPAEIPVSDHGAGREGDKVTVRLSRRNVTVPILREEDRLRDTRGGTFEKRTGDRPAYAEDRRRARGALTAAVSEVFGDAEGRQANYAAILSELEIPTDFSPEALAEAEALAARPLVREGRAVRTRELILTIDGAYAKDLDDAISLRMTEEGHFLLSVHIADVSEYVRPHSALDAAVMTRGTSLYFTDRVVPMLPPVLSNGACSLHPGEDKYALSALLTIDKNGELLDTRVERSILRSRVRGVYSEVNDLFANGDASPFLPKYKAVYPMLRRMRRLYEILEKKSRARGALSLDRPEAAIFLREDGEVERIEVTERGEAERMIEQFMLAANEGVATLLHARGIPCVYRVHDRPAPDRLADFSLFAQNLGLDVRPLTGEEITPRAFAAILDEAEERGLGRALSYSVLRTMAKAVYSAECRGHFGLGITRYCHFTSPIRRLSDLYTHRIIKAVLLDGQPPARYRATAERGASAATACELRALEAERAIESLYKALYLARRIGEEADAVISSAGPFGIFCELPDTCEGLIPMEELGEDADYVESTLSVTDGDTVFRIGDPVRIRIEEVDIPTRRVRFALA